MNDINPEASLPLLHNTISREQARAKHKSPIHARSRSKVRPEPEDGGDPHEPESFRLIDDLMRQGLGTARALAITTRLAALSGR